MPMDGGGDVKLGIGDAMLVLPLLSWHGGSGKGGGGDKNVKSSQFSAL